MSPKLQTFLDGQKIKYVRIRHSPAYTTEDVTASAHYPVNQMARTVIVELSGQLAMAVLPANQEITLRDVREVTGSDRAKFAPELEFQGKFPDCESGTIPPFGNLYNMDVYVTEALMRNDQIAFNAGSRAEIIQMSCADFERLVHPKVITFTI